MNAKIIPNPGFAGMKPTPIDAVCHDRTPFLAVRCACSFEMHVHESQVDGVRTQIVTHCKGCGELLTFPPGFFADGFQRLRDEGWIDDARSPS